MKKILIIVAILAVGLSVYFIPWFPKPKVSRVTTSSALVSNLEIMEKVLDLCQKAIGIIVTGAGVFMAQDHVKRAKKTPKEPKKTKPKAKPKR